MAVEEHSEEEGFIMTTTSACGRYGAFPAGEGSPSDREGEDDELTSLSWLQDTNLLKNYGGMEAELSDSAPSSDAFLDEPLRTEGVEEVGERHLPYNPRLHSGAKPPFSFSCLIFMAIEDSLQKALPVKDIYGWILSRFPYFQNAPTGWKNSVRHNLSLSKCFRKVDKDKGQNVGKGSLWCIDPAFRPNLLQALQKAPSMANVEFSHFSCISPSYFHKGKPDSDVKPCLLVSSQQNLKIPSPELFPFLSRHLASSMKDPEVDAAATMLTLKNGTSRTSQNLSEESESDSVSSVPIYPCKRLRYKRCGGVSKRVKGCVMTNSPSEDHTYSACNGDVAPPALPSTDNALMNLAEIATRRLLLRNS